MLTPITLGLRGLQIIFSIVTLGLAVTLLRAQVYGDAPTTTRYASFNGGFGIVVGFVGIAALFISAIPGLFIIGLDVIASLLALAGGIAYAVGLKDTENCVNGDNMYYNGLINGGLISVGDGDRIGLSNGVSTYQDLYNALKGACTRALTDEIFLFLGFALALSLAGLSFLHWRKGRGGGASYV